MKTRFFPALVSSLLLCAPVHAARDEADAYYQKALSLHGTASIEVVFDLYARAAELGNPYAQYNVAMMYANGEAVNVDYQQAAYWFRKSAERNFAPAQYRLGELYYFGMGGIERDVKSAARLFESAAERDDADAQLNLAMMLGTGDALPLDTDRALSLLEKAADGGNTAATEYRQLLMESTEGRFSDKQSADYWFRQEQFWIDRAAEFGVREAEEALDQLQNENETAEPNPAQPAGTAETTVDRSLEFRD